jgi:membrane dipeptidase
VTETAVEGAKERALVPQVGRLAALGVSEEALVLVRESPFIDLHMDTFIPPRLVGYNLTKRHGLGILRGRFFGHSDFPRVLESGLDGGMYSITTNPFRTAKSRWKVFQKNLNRFRTLVEGTEGRFQMARTLTEFQEVRARGAHAVLFSIQGGNALEAAPEGPASIPDDAIVRVTLVHLTNSAFGITSSPFKLWKGKRGLTPVGKRFVEQLNAQRIFVDLAHINPAGFWDAVEVHDKTQPLIATHTGVCGVKPHWRNLDDAQLKAIADTGGTVGVIFATNFLKPRGLRNGPDLIVAHLAHIIDTVGEDFASIGSDYDGAIIPPKGLRSIDCYPRVVQAMLDRGWGPERIQKILGGNALRALGALRP